MHQLRIRGPTVSRPVWLRATETKVPLYGLMWLEGYYIGSTTACATAQAVSVEEGGCITLTSTIAEAERRRNDVRSDAAPSGRRGASVGQLAAHKSLR